VNRGGEHVEPVGGTPVPPVEESPPQEDRGADGSLTISAPRSKAGDSLSPRAEMDLIVGLTACSAEMSNNYRFKPIEFRIV
jgi:hypothetical protein